MKIEIYLKGVKLFFQMNKNLSDIKQIILYVIITFIFCSFSPWWIISIIAILIGFYSTNKLSALLNSSLSLSITWFIMLINNIFLKDYIIVNKVRDFLGFNSITLILVTLLIPIIVGIICSLFGYELKKVIKLEE